LLLPLSSSSSSIIFFFRDEEVGWMDVDAVAVLSARERLAPMAVIGTDEGTDDGTDDDGILGKMNGKDDHGRTD
jgi:hypothetical protein